MRIDGCTEVVEVSALSGKDLVDLTSKLLEHLGLVAVKSEFSNQIDIMDKAKAQKAAEDYEKDHPNPWAW